MARIGAVAVALGLSLAGPHTIGAAGADTGRADGGATQTAPPDSSPSSGPSRPSHPSARSSTAPAREPQDNVELPAAATRSSRAGNPEDAPTVSAISVAAPAEAIPPPADVPPIQPERAVLPSLPADPPRSAVPVVSEALPAPNAATVEAPLAVSLRQPAVPPIPAPPTPEQAAVHALANFVGVLCGALAGHGPAGPADTPLSWAVMAAATRETFASGATTPAIPITPVFTALHLQEVPVVGPLFVTPVVTIVNDIPVISDLLHPLFGYPATPDGLAAPRDVWVMSADGTEINVHFMPASGLLTGQTAPTVFVGSGLGLPGATNINASPLDGILADFFGLVGVATLRNAGYNVVTWDPRGEYSSGGSIQLDSRDYEARDVSAIINWVAAQPQTQLDGTGDPRMGMVGPSYGGSIQLVTAATDHRVDAIVPTIAWNTLTDALYPNGAFKSGWGTLLEGVLLLTLARVNPRILPAVVYGDLTGKIVPEDEVLMAQRGPGPVDGYPDLVSQITAPTMLIQGTVDTLFSLQEANLTAASLVAQGVPTKMLWFCGGHGLCINNMFDLSDGALIQQRTVEWLDRYVKGEAVSTGPGFEWVDQRGQYFSMPNYGSAVGEPMLAARTGTEVLPLIPFVGGSGPLLFIAPIGGTKALNAVNLETPVSTTTTYIVGEPQLSLSYSGTGTGDHIYAQLADNTAGLVLGNQVTPIPVNLDGQHHTISIPLAPVAQTLRPGETVTLQLFAWSADYPSSSSLGSLTVNDVRLALPTYDVATPDAVTVV